MKMPDKVEKVNFGQIGPPPTHILLIIPIINEKVRQNRTV